MSLISNFKRIIATKSLFGKVFRGTFIVSVLSVLIIWYWLNSSFYKSLNREADLRLSRIARLMVDELNLRQNDPAESAHMTAMRALWQLEKSSGLVQNFYWLDMNGDKPAFIASYSAVESSGVRIPPPSAGEVEDLVFDYINQLDRGDTVFPDPFAYGVSRHVKIVLCPVIDNMGMLHSVIGIEADMEYLKLALEFRRMLAEGLISALLLSLMISWFIAQSLSTRVDRLNDCVRKLENGEEPEKLTPGVAEFDRLYVSFLEMAKALYEEKEQLNLFFHRKLNELAFTGGAIAHEIRNPLSAIEMHFGLLRREIQNGSNGVTGDSVKEISEQLQHLRTLLENFLDYTRKVEPQIERFFLRQALEEIFSLRLKVLGSFDYELLLDEKFAIEFDKTMFRQIIENLVNNSFAATNGAGLRISISAALESRRLNITYTDNGPGIPESIMEQLFTPFASSTVGGSGFGLAVIRKLVEVNSGTISGSNLPERGAKFVIEVWQ